MKKRILSLILALIITMCVIPFGVFAEGERMTSTIEGWTVKKGTFNAIEGGFSSSATAKAIRVIKWNGLIYEGKISAEFKTDNMLSTNDNTGFLFGASGLDTVTDVSRAGAQHADLEKAGVNFYLCYFAGDSINIGRAENGKWIGSEGRSVNLITALGDKWTNEYKVADTVKLSLSFSHTGELRLWINDECVYSIDSSANNRCVPYGGDLGIRTGFHGGNIEVTNFKIEGGLEFKTVQGSATYDAANYTFTTSENNTFAYFANRQVKDGKIVVISRGESGIRGAAFGINLIEGVPYWEGAGISYYMFDMNANRICISDTDGKTDVSTLTTTSGTQFQTNNNGKWIFGSNAGAEVNTVDFKITSSLATIVLNKANGTTTATDSSSIQGGLYGIRVANANTKLAYYVINNVREAMGLDMSISEKTLNKGETVTLTTTTFPSGSVINSGADIVWASSDESVATVDENGKVTAVKSGLVTITATVNNHIYGDLVAECEVHVHALEKVDAVPSNCQNAGVGEHYACHGCGDVKYEDAKGKNVISDEDLEIPINPNKHVYGDDRICDLCGYETTVTQQPTDDGADIGDAAGNDEVKDNGDNNNSAVIWIIVAVAAVAVVAAVVVVIVTKKKK